VSARRARAAPLVLAAIGFAFLVAGGARMLPAFPRDSITLAAIGATVVMVGAALGAPKVRYFLSRRGALLWVAVLLLDVLGGFGGESGAAAGFGVVMGFGGALMVASLVDPSFKPLAIRNPTAIVRSARNSDRSVVQELVRDVLAQYGLAYDRAGSDRTLEDLEAFYIRAGGAFWVVEDAGAIVATVAVRKKSAEVFELEKMYIRRSHRGKGLGKRLLELGIDFARAAGARRLELDTSSKLVEAVALYEKRGFLPKPEIESPRCDRAYFLPL
jgi:putative acetyltransferase